MNVIEPVSSQFARLLLEALKEDGLYQVGLARRMGISSKHVNHMVHGKGGSVPMYEDAAFALGRTWKLSLVRIYDE